MSTSYTITALAEAFAITTRAIRFYEDKGLLAPARQGQARVYSHRDRVRLSFIVRGRKVGLTLAEIKELLDLYDIKNGREAQYVAAISKFEERIGKLQAQKDEIDRAIDELREWTGLIQKELDGLSPEAESRLGELEGAGRSIAAE